MERIKKLALLIGPDADDPELLELLMDQSESAIKAMTGRDELPAGLEPAALLLAAVFFNRRGMEGETRLSEGSVTHENAGMPDEILRMVRPYCLAKAVRQ